MAKMTAEQKTAVAKQFGLQLATFPKETARQQATAEEFAVFKALCATQTFGLKSLMMETENVNNINVDSRVKMAQSGNAQSHTLISLWSRNQLSEKRENADKRDYGVRMHIDVINRLYQSQQFAEVIKERNVEVINEKNGIEIRFTFNSLADALKFIADCADAIKETDSTAEEQKTEETAQQTAEENADSTAQQKSDKKSKRQQKRQQKSKKELKDVDAEELAQLTKEIIESETAVK